MAGTVMTQNFDLTRGYFGDAQQVHLPDVFPPFLHSEVPKHDGVVACEGSMFKSKFANALTAMIVGSLGIASAHNKLSVAYGGEAGAMDPLLQKMCKRYCHDSLVITRNAESQEMLGKLGVATELGTDTAWTFEPLGPEYGRKALRDAGWDGSTPVLAVCPINPFWWPVKPSLGKSLAHSVWRRLREELLPHDLLSPLGPRRGRGIREISLGDGRAASSATAKRAPCFRCWSPWRCSTATPASASRRKSAARRSSRRTSSTCTSW